MQTVIQTGCYPSPRVSDYIVFEATEAYAMLPGESTPPMLSFRTWWLFINEFMQKVLPPEVQDVFAKMPYHSGQRLLFFTEITPLWRAGWR
jgi:hypothetical protein